MLGSWMVSSKESRKLNGQHAVGYRLSSDSSVCLLSTDIASRSTCFLLLGSDGAYASRYRQEESTGVPCTFVTAEHDGGGEEEPSSWHNSREAIVIGGAVAIPGN